MEEGPRDRAGEHAVEDVPARPGERAVEERASLSEAPSTSSSGRRRRIVGRLRDAWKRLRGGELTPGRAAASVAIGLLIGATPLYGLHLILVVGVCLPLRLDAPVAYLAANISNPFIAPFLMFAEIETGSFLHGGHAADVSVDALRATGPGPYFRDMVIGTLAFAPALAIVGGALTWVMVWLGKRARASS